MTLITEINRNNYDATSGQTVFAYGFRILADSDLNVYVEGVLKTLTTDYTVSGAGDATGGNVTFTSGETPDDKVVIIRVEPQTQGSAYTGSGAFPSNTHEKALDKQMMVMQDVDEKLARSIKFIISSTLSAIDAPEGSSATDRGSKVWAWNGAGTALELIAATNVDSTSLIAVKGDTIQGGDTGAAEKHAIGTAGQSREVVSGKLGYVTQKTLSDFTNAQHDHSNTANAGTLPSTASVSTNYRSGLNCKQASTTTITVQAGVIDVDGTRVAKTADTTLTLGTATDWVDDTSDQAVSKYIYIYINAAAKIEMDDVAPDEADTSGNTSGILRYNDTGTDTSDRRMLSWAYLNATGSGELSTYEVGNLKDGDVQNSVLRTDSTQNTVNDAAYGADLTNTQIHFYTSGRGQVEIKCVIVGNVSQGMEYTAILNDGSDIVPSQDGAQHGSVGTSESDDAMPTHAEVYAQGGVTFEAKAKTDTTNWVVEEKTMIIQEN